MSDAATSSSAKGKAKARAADTEAGTESAPPAKAAKVNEPGMQLFSRRTPTREIWAKPPPKAYPELPALLALDNAALISQANRNDGDRFRAIASVLAARQLAPVPPALSPSPSAGIGPSTAASSSVAVATATSSSSSTTTFTHLRGPELGELPRVRYVLEREKSGARTEGPYLSYTRDGKYETRLLLENFDGTHVNMLKMAMQKYLIGNDKTADSKMRKRIREQPADGSKPPPGKEWQSRGLPIVTAYFQEKLRKKHNYTLREFNRDFVELCSAWDLNLPFSEAQGEPTTRKIPDRQRLATQAHVTYNEQRRRWHLTFSGKKDDFDTEEEVYAVKARIEGACTEYDSSVSVEQIWDMAVSVEAKRDDYVERAKTKKVASTELRLALFHQMQRLDCATYYGSRHAAQGVNHRCFARQPDADYHRTTWPDWLDAEIGGLTTSHELFQVVPCALWNSYDCLAHRLQYDIDVLFTADVNVARAYRRFSDHVYSWLDLPPLKPSQLLSGAVLRAHGPSSRLLPLPLSSDRAGKNAVGSYIAAVASETAGAAVHLSPHPAYTLNEALFSVPKCVNSSIFNFEALFQTDATAEQHRTRRRYNIIIEILRNRRPSFDKELSIFALDGKLGQHVAQNLLLTTSFYNSAKYSMVPSLAELLCFALALHNLARPVIGDEKVDSLLASLLQKIHKISSNSDAYFFANIKNTASKPNVAEVEERAERVMSRLPREVMKLPILGSSSTIDAAQTGEAEVTTDGQLEKVKQRAAEDEESTSDRGALLPRVVKSAVPTQYLTEEVKRGVKTCLQEFRHKLQAHGVALRALPVDAEGLPDLYGQGAWANNLAFHQARTEREELCDEAQPLPSCSPNIRLVSDIATKVFTTTAFGAAASSSLASTLPADGLAAYHKKSAVTGALLDSFYFMTGFYENCHVTGLPIANLNTPYDPLRLSHCHRVHGVPMWHGFRTEAPASLEDFCPLAVNRGVESWFANLLRNGWEFLGSYLEESLAHLLWYSRMSLDNDLALGSEVEMQIESYYSSDPRRLKWHPSADVQALATNNLSKQEQVSIPTLLEFTHDA